MADQTQNKPSSVNLRYIKELLKILEDDSQKFSPDVLTNADKEYKDLISNKDIKCPQLPMKIVKIDTLTKEQLEDSPNLVQVLKYATEKRITNANNAWIEYLTLLEKKALKPELEKQQHGKQEDNKEQQQLEQQEQEEQQQLSSNEKQKEKGSSEESKTAAPSTSEDDQAMDCEQTMNYKPIRNLLKSETAQNEADLLSEAEKEYTELLTQRGQQDTEESYTSWQSGDIKDIQEEQQQVAPKLYEIIVIVSGKTQEHWPTAVTEFIKLTSKLDSPDSDMTGISVAQYVCPPEQSPEQSPIKRLIVNGNRDDDNLDQAHKDYIRLYTSESYLITAFPAANFLQYMKCTIDTKEEIQEKLPFEAEYYPYLYMYLDKTTSECQDDELCKQLWNEFAKLIIVDKQLDLAKRAQGPNLDTNILVPRLDFERLQNELQRKYEEVDELSTRLSRFASIQLTEGNPNIADLSDSHRPTKIGEMFSQLYDDEWSEAFEALKPKDDSKTEDDGNDEEEDNFYIDVLKQLQEIAMKSYAFCKTLTQSQFEYAQKELKYITYLEMDSRSDELAAPAASDENEASDAKADKDQSDAKVDTDKSDAKVDTDQSVTETSAEEQSKDDKPDTVDPHKQFIDRQAKEYRKVSSSISSNKASEIFEEKELPKIITPEGLLEDSRIKAYTRKCVQLTWYMCVQDPPMKMICLEKGDQMKRQQFSFFGRKGKTVEVCLWPALLLHEDGPIVSKGFVLPQK